MTKKQLFTMWLALFAMLILLPSADARAEHKVQYGKSSFTLYKPLPGLAPLPPIGLKPATPGYRIKNPLWGPGTYSPEAPGTVPPTNYKCILTEMRDWVFLREDEVKQAAAKRGLKEIDGKALAKQAAKTFNASAGVHNDSLTYAVSETSWISFEVSQIFMSKFEKSGAPVNTEERYVVEVSFIEKVPAQTSAVLDRMYRFWNDGANFGKVMAVGHKRHGVAETRPNDQNPNSFVITDYLIPDKGFFRLSFENGQPPVYVWHSYQKVVTANLKHQDFEASGSIAHSDRYDSTDAFAYGMLAGISGKDVYFTYNVGVHRLYPIYSPNAYPDGWKNTLPERRKYQAAVEKATKAARDQHMGAGGFEIQAEKHYTEIFK